nr:polyketide synthase dehydratase domain-containing protein [Teredinibacter haidensis]
MFDRSDLYSKFKQAGFQYGESFQTITNMYIGDRFCLGQTAVSEIVKEDFDEYLMHPSLLAGALQTVAGLIGHDWGGATSVHFATEEIWLLRSLTPNCIAFVENADS